MNTLHVLSILCFRAATGTGTECLANMHLVALVDMSQSMLCTYEYGAQHMDNDNELFDCSGQHYKSQGWMTTFIDRLIDWVDKSPEPGLSFGIAGFGFDIKHVKLYHDYNADKEAGPLLNFDEWTSPREAKQLYREVLKKYNYAGDAPLHLGFQAVNQMFREVGAKKRAIIFLTEGAPPIKRSDALRMAEEYRSDGVPIVTFLLSTNRDKQKLDLSYATGKSDNYELKTFFDPKNIVDMDSNVFSRICSAMEQERAAENAAGAETVSVALVGAIIGSVGIVVLALVVVLLVKHMYPGGVELVRMSNPDDEEGEGEEGSDEPAPHQDVEQASHGKTAGKSARTATRLSAKTGSTKKSKAASSKKTGSMTSKKQSSSKSKKETSQEGSEKEKSKTEQHGSTKKEGSESKFESEKEASEK